MHSTKLIEVVGDVYRVVICSNTPDRDAMAEVAEFLGAQLTPEIMEAQGHDWQTSSRRGIAGLRVGDNVPSFDGVAAWILTAYPPEKVATPQPIDACKDGILQQSDGRDWTPVTIPRKSHYYDGKKWMPDYPAGHVRTIPCRGER